MPKYGANEEASVLSLLANAKRLMIVKHLIEEEMTVGALAEKLSLSQSALSQHLAKLRNKNLVESRREHRHIYYSCKSEDVRLLLNALDHMLDKR